MLSQILTLSNQTSRYIRKCIRFIFDKSVRRFEVQGTLLRAAKTGVFISVVGYSHQKASVIRCLVHDLKGTLTC